MSAVSCSRSCLQLSSCVHPSVTGACPIGRARVDYSRSGDRPVFSIGEQSPDAVLPRHRIVRTGGHQEREVIARAIHTLIHDARARDRSPCSSHVRGTPRVNCQYTFRLVSIRRPETCTRMPSITAIYRSTARNAIEMSRFSKIPGSSWVSDSTWSHASRRIAVLAPSTPGGCLISSVVPFRDVVAIRVRARCTPRRPCRTG